MAFEPLEVLPGVWHIRDVMGVCMTLLVGSDRALLVDTGYGLEDPSAFVLSLMDRPLQVMLTHGHHDHALGARWFDQVSIFPEDLSVYRQYTGRLWRNNVLNSARERQLNLDGEAFLSAPMPEPAVLTEGELSLGGLTARILSCPGHTPGSAVVFVPELALLLTGDDWNPCTWLFFPEALPLQQWRANLMKLSRLPFRHVLCSHQHQLLPRSQLEAFWAGLTEENLAVAQPVDTGSRVGVRTVEAHLPLGQVLVFDPDKAQMR